jgi:hypothetical protein
VKKDILFINRTYYVTLILTRRVHMKLRAFSVSLNVKDISISKAFYEKLGFQALGGDIAQNWIIMKNESCVIGLFQGIFEKNILTFNPGIRMQKTPIHLQSCMNSKGI